MPYFTPHGINVALGTFDYRSSVTLNPGIGNTAAVTAALNALDAHYQKSENEGCLREFRLLNRTDAIKGDNDYRLLGGKCGVCGDCDANDACVRSGQHDASIPARFYLVMVESSGDQRPAIERKKQALFKEHRILPEQLHEFGKNQDVPELENANQCRRASLDPNAQLFALNDLQTPFCDGEEKPSANQRSLLVKLPISKRKLQLTVQRESVKALCLTVRLHKDSFPLQPLARRDRNMDVKIDVYYNGEFVKCDFVPHRAKQESNKEELVHRFHGKRVRMKAEKPWIVLSESLPGTQGQEHISKQGQDATGHEGKAPGTANANARWQEISIRLREEGQYLEFGADGKRTEIGKYLRELATLPVPSQVQERQTRSRLSFGLIDVILTMGRGKKYDTKERYITDAKAMTIGASDDMKHPIASNTKNWSETLQQNDPSDTFQRSKQSHLLAELQNRSAPSGIRNTTRKRTRILLAGGPNRKRQRLEAATRHTSISQIKPSARPAGLGTGNVQSLGELLSGDVHEIAQTGNDEVNGSGFGGGRINDPLKSITQKGTAVGELSIGSDDTGDRRPSPCEEGSSPLPSMGLPTPAVKDLRSGHSEAFRQARRASIDQQIEPAFTKYVDYDPGTDWNPGTIHDGSILSYPSDELRQVKSERSGDFEESSILFGVRYVVF